jgi:hypothetical protein
MSCLWHTYSITNLLCMLLVFACLLVGVCLQLLAAINGRHAKHVHDSNEDLQALNEMLLKILNDREVRTCDCDYDLWLLHNVHPFICYFCVLTSLHCASPS